MERRQLVPYVKQRVGLVRRTVIRRLYMDQAHMRTVVDDFHRLYYESEAFGGTWRSTTWMGTPLKKCPLDLWVYQEMLHELQPDLIVETGTWRGGSALYLATLCDLLDKGRVVSVDISPEPPLPSHHRLHFLRGSSTDPGVVEEIRAMTAPNASVMVILDSNHSFEHVLKELRTYAPMVPVGGYVIVEDTNVNGHPVAPEFGPGPTEAVVQFLQEQNDFVVDSTREKYYMTFNPGGFLRRVR